MNEKWYYAKNRQKVGPVSLEQLRQLLGSGELVPSDMVLGEGSQKWVPISSVPEPIAMNETVPFAAGSTNTTPLINSQSDGEQPGPIKMPTPEVVPAVCAASSSDGQPAGVSRKVGHLFLREIKETALAPWRQSTRLFQYGQDCWRGHLVSKKYSAAKLNLGQRLYGANEGDDQLRSQIVSLEARIRTAEAEKQSTTSLKIKRDRLLVQLSEAVLTEQAPQAMPAGTEAEYGKARETQAAFDKHTGEIAASRRSLLPNGSAEWRQVVVGHIAMVCIILLPLLLLRHQGADADATGESREQSLVNSIVAGDVVQDGKSFGNIDLLTIANPEKHTCKGQWKLQGKDLVSVPTGHSILEIPHAVPEEYTLKLQVERKAGNDALGIGLLVGDRRCLVVLDAGPKSGYLSGLEMIDGKTAGANETTKKGQVFKNDTPSEVVCTVRREAIAVAVDGKTVMEFKGNPDRLTLGDFWKTPNERALFVGAQNFTSYHLSRLELTPLSSDDGKLAKKAPLAKNEEKEPHSGFTKRTAEGVGPTDDESLKDAFRKAIWQEVGVVVDAETIVKNDSIISDKILSYADGIIKSYKVVGTRKEHGLVWTTIQAEVERRSVIARIKQADLPIRSLDGKGLAAQALTDLQAAKNAKLLMDKALEGFPLNVLEVHVGKPEIVSRNDTVVTCRFQVDFQVNQKQYYQFVNKLQNTLQVIAKDRGERVFNGTFLDDTVSRPRHTHTLFVNYSCEGSGKQEKRHWRYFVVDDTVCGSLFRSFYFIQARISLVNKEGVEVTSEVVPKIGNRGGYNPFTPLGASQESGASHIYPRFSLFGAATHRVQQDVTLPYKQWEMVDSVRSELLNGGLPSINRYYR